nr:hypothetical protein L203_06116 [Cryptococcus depauperatus CBS 7841]
MPQSRHSSTVVRYNCDDLSTAMTQAQTYYPVHPIHHKSNTLRSKAIIGIFPRKHLPHTKIVNRRWIKHLGAISSHLCYIQAENLATQLTSHNEYLSAISSSDSTRSSARDITRSNLRPQKNSHKRKSMLKRYRIMSHRVIWKCYMGNGLNRSPLLTSTPLLTSKQKDQVGGMVTGWCTGTCV